MAPNRLLLCDDIDQTVDPNLNTKAGHAVGPQSDRQEATEGEARRRARVVEVNGFEPMTPCLQSRCSPS